MFGCPSSTFAHLLHRTDGVGHVFASFDQTEHSEGTRIHMQCWTLHTNLSLFSSFVLIQQTKLLQGTTVYTQWENLNVPFYSRFYLFNVENPKQVTKGAIPILRERGPYTYRQWQKKEIIGWSEDYLYLSYRVHTIYEFDANRTVGSEDDEVTILNIPLIVSGFIFVSRQREGSVLFAFSLFHYLCRKLNQNIFF